MATIEKTLQIPFKYDGIVRKIKFNYGEVNFAGGDILQINAGEYLGVPLEWSMIHGQLWVATSAVVGNRYIQVGHYNEDANFGYELIQGPAVAASNASVLSLSQVQALAGSATFSSSGGHIALGSEGLIIEGGDNIRVALDGAQAGDTLKGVFAFKLLNWSNSPWLSKVIKSNLPN